VPLFFQVRYMKYKKPASAFLSINVDCLSEGASKKPSKCVFYV
jgi:hypothetical protein